MKTELLTQNDAAKITQHIIEKTIQNLYNTDINAGDYVLMVDWDYFAARLTSEFTYSEILDKVQVDWQFYHNSWDFDTIVRRQTLETVVTKLHKVKVGHTPEVWSLPGVLNAHSIIMKPAYHTLVRWDEHYTTGVFAEPEEVREGKLRIRRDYQVGYALCYDRMVERPIQMTDGFELFGIQLVKPRIVNVREYEHVTDNQEVLNAFTEFKKLVNVALFELRSELAKHSNLTKKEIRKIVEEK